MALGCQVFNPFVVAFGEQDRPGEAAAAAAAAAGATTPGTLRKEQGETEEPAIPTGGSLEKGGLVKALPANVGLMTLMQLVEEEGRHKDKDNGPWEELSRVVRPASERRGRLTLLVRKRKRRACSPFIFRASWVS